MKMNKGIKSLWFVEHLHCMKKLLQVLLQKIWFKELNINYSHYIKKKLEELCAKNF